MEITCLITFQTSKNMLISLSHEFCSIFKLKFIVFIIFEIQQLKYWENRDKFNKIWIKRTRSSESTILEACKEPRYEILLQADERPRLWEMFSKGEVSFFPKYILDDRIIFLYHVED